MAERARTPLSLRERPAEDEGGRSGLPSLRGDDLRRHLPGVEPDRTLTDWGRSERVERVLDETLVDFLYRYWFRAEVEGIENVPASGGALLVSNHSGALPPGRHDDRQGHPRGASAPAAAEHHRRALLQGLPRLLDAAAQGRRGGRPPGQRAPPALRRAAAGARVPRGPQGHREAVQGPLPPAPLRPRRLRAGGHEGARADRARVRRGRRGGGAGVRAVRTCSRSSPACCTCR